MAFVNVQSLGRKHWPMSYVIILCTIFMQHINKKKKEITLDKNKVIARKHETKGDFLYCREVFTNE